MALDFEKRDGIALLGMNRPEAKNALDAGLLRELLEAWNEIAADDAIRATVLYSKLPDIFCAGMDLKTVIAVLTGARAPENDDERWIVGDPSGVFRSMLRQREWDKPVISAVHGLCLTGGFEMVMGTDLRLASDDAGFQMRETSYGIMPVGGSTVFLPRQIPLAAAKEILMLGEVVPAQRLYQWGFLNRVVPREKLMDTALAMAQRICNNGPLAVQGVLKSIRLNAALNVDQAMQLELEIGMPIFSSADAREGVLAFKEKRKAQFKGE
ncbi:MAG: enoyl-CoA hydratase-related protein [Candidatus Alcyoniella australis]|nr:enoyl-CoA hydratase-related protein [Candidatus Alcyoniella australis]